MSLPLRLNWMGRETGDICGLLKPYHPLILISPVPEAQTSSSEFTLPGSVSKSWNLASPESIDSLKNRSSGLNGEVRFEVAGLQSDSPESGSLLDDFYVNLYLKNTALFHLANMTPYSYVESIHRDLLREKYFAIARALKDGRTVSGCLLRHPSVNEQRGYEIRLGVSFDEGNPVLILDSLCSDARLDRAGLICYTISHLAQWARSAGYAYLSTPPAPALTIIRNCDEITWDAGSETIPVFHTGSAARLYCDFTRCSFLKPDICFYCYEDARPGFYYLANGTLDPSHLAALLESLHGIRKAVYTRHTHFLGAAPGKEVEYIRL